MTSHTKEYSIYLIHSFARLYTKSEQYRGGAHITANKLLAMAGHANSGYTTATCKRSAQLLLAVTEI
jgi:hypothetical protein